MTQFKEQDTRNFATFNNFFTRELGEGAREIEHTPYNLISPCDGTISQIGEIVEGNIFQAKGMTYSLANLLGGEIDDCFDFKNGKFITIYLSPADYHRVHMPCDGALIAMNHIPGRLWSVAEDYINHVSGLFTKNERVACVFDTPHGKVASVMVGALNVGAIETVWHGLVTPPRETEVVRHEYGKQVKVSLRAGDEMGRFNMGSTVILCLPETLVWDEQMKPNDKVKLGQALGVFKRETNQN